MHGVEVVIWVFVLSGTGWLVRWRDFCISRLIGGEIPVSLTTDYLKETTDCLITWIKGHYAAIY